MASSITGRTHGHRALLAIITSASMRERTTAGGTRLETARAAAGVFLDLVNLAAGNQAALVTFDAEARLAQAAMANQPAYVYHAPGAAALEAIYRAVAATIPCPGGGS